MSALLHLRLSSWVVKYFSIHQLKTWSNNHYSVVKTIIAVIADFSKMSSGITELVDGAVDFLTSVRDTPVSSSGGVIDYPGSMQRSSLPPAGIVSPLPEDSFFQMLINSSFINHHMIQYYTARIK
jgi:hypothetical protein